MSSRRKVHSVYLAHPYAEVVFGKTIQKAIEGCGIEVINPFERGEQAIYDAKLGPGGTGLDAQDCADIVHMDLEKIDIVDGVFAYLPGVQSIGTFMEIFYAGHVLRKPVFSYATNEWMAKHPWVRYYSTVVSGEFTELLDAMIGLETAIAH